MLPVGVKVPVDCAKTTLQNDRTKTNCNAAGLLLIILSPKSESPSSEPDMLGMSLLVKSHEFSSQLALLFFKTLNGSRYRRQNAHADLVTGTLLSMPGPGRNCRCDRFRFDAREYPLFSSYPKRYPQVLHGSPKAPFANSRQPQIR